ncbi:MAG: IS110 family transposase [Oscillospiraceae bacterium]|nr:IS110 family transposase [Oscillospiraceae bacterium]
MERRLCVGIDLHKTQFTVCAMREEDGLVVLEEQYATTETGYREFTEEMHTEEENGYSIELAIETTGNARYFKNRMEAEGFGVVVVNTNKFKVITMSTKKTDANDAETLAYYLMKEMLPEAHLCDQTSEEIRRLLKTRSILVQSRVKIKNQIHGMLLGYGIETKRAQFQSKKKRQELYKDLADQGYSQFTASSLEVTLSILDEIDQQIKRVEDQLHEMLDEDETVKLLMTVPGIGFIGAWTIAAYTKDMERFGGDFKRFSSYLGLVPSVHNSNESRHLGRITKHGPQDLRTAFVQVAMGVIRQPQNTGDWRLMKDYYRMKAEKGSGRAIIALTRKMARIVFAILNNRTEFDPSRMVSEHISTMQTA